MHRGGNAQHQIVVRQTVFQRAQQRFDQTVTRTQLTQRLAANALNVIFQIRVFKTTEDFLDVCRMFIGIKTVTLNQHRAAFFHRAFHNRADFLVQNGVTNGLVTGQFSEVGGYSMPGVKGEEFALDKRH